MPDTFLCKGMFNFIIVYFIVVSCIMTCIYDNFVNRMVNHGVDIYSKILIVVI